MGVKIAAHDLEKAVAGLQLFVATNDAEVERFKQICLSEFSDAMRAIISLTRVCTCKRPPLVHWKRCWCSSRTLRFPIVGFALVRW